MKYKSIMGESYLKNSDPLNYFIDYVRYDYLITLEFDKKSDMWRTFQAIKYNLKKLFFVYRKTESSSRYKITISFSDYMKLNIFYNLFIDFWFDEKKLGEIKWLLRYDVFETIKSNKKCSQYAKMYAKKPKLFMNLYPFMHPNCDMKIVVKKIKKELKEKNATMEIKYFSEDDFEKILYYSLHYKKNAIIFFDCPFSHDDVEYSVRYLIWKTKIPFLSGGVYINVMHLLSFQKSEFNKDLKLWFEVISDSEDDFSINDENKKWTFGYKMAYIEELQSKRNDILENFRKVSESWDLTPEMEKDYENNMAIINEKILKANLELHFHMYDVEEKNFNIPEWFSKLFEDISEAINKTSNSELKISVKNWNPMYMTNKFSDSDLSKYQELKEYASYSWDIWFKYHKCQKKWVSWKRIFKYKSKTDKQRWKGKSD